MEQRHQALIELILGFIPAQAVSVAAELGIADLLAREAMTADELAAATHTHPPTLFRLLRFLASLGIFQADQDHRFSLTPMAALLRSDVDDSLRPFAQIMGRIGPRTTHHLIDAVRSAEYPFELAFGTPLFAYLSEHLDEAQLFDAAMNGHHSGETEAVLNAYDFRALSTVADIGCGNGSVLSATLKRYPDMRGVFFDLPHVIERTRPHVQAAGLTERADLVSGSFFESVPAGADAYVLRHIIHDWSDEASCRILRTIRRAIAPTARVLIVEMLVPEGNDRSPAKSLDMVMMLFPPQGLERTDDQFRGLFASSGFALSGITPTASPVSVIEGRPI